MEGTKRSIFNISEMREMYREGEKLAREYGIEYIGDDFSLGITETAEKGKRRRLRCPDLALVTKSRGDL